MVLRWTPALQLGIAEIDTQHARLIELIDRLRLATVAGSAEMAALGVLAELVDYTQYHFATEWRYMQQHGYADSPAHQREHDAMTDRVGGFVDQFTNGTTTLPTDLLAFLEGWLARHINGTDRLLCEYLKSKGVQ